MTAIHGYIQPTRRPGELGVHSVDHFHFAVADLAVAQNFYGEFGLDVGQRGNRLTLSTFAQPHVWGTIAEGPRKKSDSKAAPAQPAKTPVKKKINDLIQGARGGQGAANRSIIGG